ncbi:MAG: deoxyribonuclease V [Dehalococcoidia bacterium]
MDLLDLHPWDVTPREAVAIQRELAGRVVRSGGPRAVRRIAGVDCSVDRAEGRATGAVVVLSYPDLDVVEVAVAETALTFPYVPGLLSFREVPVLREAFRKIAGPIDLLLVDGQGYAHPRRFGLACHLGLLLDLPAIGCAKSRLLGEHEMPAEAAGSRAGLRDGGELIGSVLRTRDGVRPLYISVGHRIGLRAAERWVLRCCRGFRLPEPTRLADKAAGGRAPAPSTRSDALPAVALR